MIASMVVRARDLSRMAGAFTRLDLIDEISYPMAASLRYFGLVVPVLIQFFVAELVGPSSGGSLGSDYFTFSAVGIAVAAAMQMALSRLGARLQIMQNQGTLESLLVVPVPWTFVPIAMNVWHISSGLLAAGLILGLAAVLGAQLVVTGLAAFLLVILLGAGAAMAIGIISASLLVLTKRAEPVVRLYGLAASLLGGAVFPVELLPGWLRFFSYLIPHTYVISASRSTLMAEPPTTGGPDLWPSVGALGAFDLVLLPLGVYAFARALDYARRTGLLHSY